MSAGEQLMVASFVDELRCGSEFELWPPHLTIYPWFTLLEGAWDRFNDWLEDIVIEETTQPIIKGGEKVYFGEAEDIPARRLDVTRSFNLLNGFDIHANIFKAVHRFGKDWQDDYMGVDWRPHITDSPEFALAANEELTLNNLTVVQKRSIGRKLVRAVYRWKGEHEQVATA